MFPKKRVSLSLAQCFAAEYSPCFGYVLSSVFVPFFCVFDVALGLVAFTVVSYRFMSLVLGCADLVAPIYFSAER